MAEIGIVASVLSVLGAAVASSKAVLEMVDDIRNASTEIKAISEDTRAFHGVVVSLLLAVRSPTVKAILQQDCELREDVANLVDPVQNCAAALIEIQSMIQPHLKSGSQGKYRISSLDMRWMFSKKKEVMDCKSRLEKTKNTLGTALAGINLILSIKSAGSNPRRIKSLDLRDQAHTADTGLVLKDYAESVVTNSPTLTSADESTLYADSYTSSTRQDAESTAPQPPKLPTAFRRPPEQRFTRNSEEHKQFMHDAVKEGNTEYLARQLEAGFDPNTCLLPNGYTSLHLAVYHNHMDVVSLLVKHDANLDLESADTHELWGGAPLCIAASKGLAKMVQLLLDSGADAHAKCESNYYKTPLHRASGIGSSYHAVKILVRHAEALGELARMLEATDSWGGTSIHHAAAGGNIDIARLLVDSGADANAWSDTTGSTPLLEAARKGQLSVMRFLVSRGADYHVKNYNDLEPSQLLKGEMRENFLDFIRSKEAQWKEEVQSKDEK